MLGVAVSAWLLHYTDSFETVGGLLALGGLFSWLAFVSKVLPDAILKAIQWKSVDLLELRVTTLVIVIVVIASAVAASFFGSVRVEIGREGLASSLTLDPEGQHGSGPVALNSGKPTNYLRAAAFMRGAPYRMKVPGLPNKVVMLEPWSLNKVYIPNSFDRRVFLVRPSKDVTLDILNNPIHLKITVIRDRRVLVAAPISPYFGYSFWVNCSADVEIPGNVQADFLNDVPNSAAEKYKALWFTPRPTLLSKTIVARFGVTR